MLPFQRIAIFEADLVFPRSIDLLSMSELRSQVLAWASNVIAHGADALYLRWRGSVQLPLHEWLAIETGLPLLCPAGWPELGSGIHGIHLREEEAVPDQIGLIPWIGRSCHSLATARQAQSEGLDYIFLSPIFATRSHPEAKPKGLGYLKNACMELDIPVFALGGMNRAREKACLSAGADGVAGIRMFLP